jgi:glycosyltransferase involved in cell wall biosynthesis
LYAACDCFVLPSRGEGFGLPYMEASLCGLPIIATNYSGHTMFLNYSNAFLLEIDKLSKATSTGVHFWDGQMFPEMKDSSVQLGSLMQNVYNNYDAAKMKNHLLQSEISNNYTYSAVGKVAKQHLERIWNNLL